jgi:hypothetical protein
MASTPRDFLRHRISFSPFMITKFETKGAERAKLRQR